MPKPGLDDVLEPHRRHLQGEAIPSVGEGEPVSDELALLHDLDALARSVKRRARTVSWLEQVVIRAFELGKRCGPHGAEDKLRFGRTQRKVQRERAKKGAEAISAEAQDRRTQIQVLNAEYDNEYGYDRTEESFDKRAGIFASKLKLRKKTVLDHMRALRKAQRSPSAHKS